MQTTTYLYRPALKRAFETTKKSKLLWFFGLFAVLVSAGGEYEIIARAYYYNGDSGGLIQSFLASFQSGWSEGLKLADGNFWSNFSRLIVQNPAAVAMTLFALLSITVLTLFIIWLAIASQIALIRGCSLAAKNKLLAIGEGLDYANRNFWPVAAIVAVLKIALFILFGAISWEIMLLTGSGTLGLILYIISFVVFTLAVLVVSFILKYQIFFVLLKRQKFIVALKSAWELFKGNWLISLEMALIMFGAYLVAAGLTALIIAFCAGIPIVVVPFYMSATPEALKWLIAIVAALLMAVGVLFTTAIMTTFQWAGWTALFERLAGDDDGVSKLERWGEELRKLPEVILG